MKTQLVNLADYILTPLSYIYGAVVWTRNKLFDWGILKQEEFDVPVLVIGNITVGGTGKTPHAEYIIEHLCHDYHIGVLSRGYKRKTKGFIQATNQLSPNDIGDEPYQMYRKYGNIVTLAVCESRRDGIKEMLKIDPKINLFVLDDAFQHRYVKPKVSVALVDYNHPVDKDRMLPLGRLREPMYSLLRCDIVIVTKCPEDIKPVDISLMKKRLDLYPSHELFFSTFQYYNLMPIFPERVMDLPSLNHLNSEDSVLIVTGIANHIPFVKFIKAFNVKIKVIHFGDHHNFTRDDFALMEDRFNKLQGNRKYLISTEKDAVRMENNPYFPHRLKSASFYVPIKVNFLKTSEDSDFIETLKKKL